VTGLRGSWTKLFFVFTAEPARIFPREGSGAQEIYPSRPKYERSVKTQENPPAHNHLDRGGGSCKIF